MRSSSPARSASPARGARPPSPQRASAAPAMPVSSYSPPAHLRMPNPMSPQPSAPSFQPSAPSPMQGMAAGSAANDRNNDDALHAALEAKALIADMHKLQQDMCTALDSMMKVQQEMWTGLASIAGGVDRLAMACEELLQSQPQAASPSSRPPSVPGLNGITIIYETGWEDCYIHFNADGKGWTTVPGEKMQRGVGDLASAQVFTIDAEELEFVTTNGGADWDKPMDKAGHYVVAEPGVYVLRNGKIEML